MKVELLVSEWCPTCPAAEKVWRDVLKEREFDFSVVDAAQPEGRELIARLRLRSVPSVVVDGVLQAVGVQTMEEARGLIASAPLRLHAPRAHHVGMMLARDNRIWILAAMAYLLISGVAMLARGGLLSDGLNRAAAVHAFGAGFVLFLIYAMASHMLPRFTGNPIASAPWNWLQLATGNVGVPLLASGLWIQSRGSVIAGGVLVWLSIAIFAARILPVLFPGASGERAVSEAMELPL